MDKHKEIQDFFDQMSVNRDQKLNRNTLHHYEQLMRQEAVIELLDPTIGEVVLDAGAGNLRDSVLFLSLGMKVISLDISAGMLLEGIYKIRDESTPACLQGSALNLPLSNGIFDKISCSEVIEHIPDYQLVLREFNRCLKSNGILVITTPNWNSLYGVNRRLIEFVQKLFQMKAWGKHPFDEWKTYDELEKIIENSGFRIDRKLGICYLPGFSFGKILPDYLLKLIVKIVHLIEIRIRTVAFKSGYGIGIRARKIYNYD